MGGLREQPARVLANRPLEADGEVFMRETAGSAQRPQGQRQITAQPLPLANLAQIFLASTGIAP